MIKELLFEEVTNYFRRTQDILKETASSSMDILDFRIRSMPEIRFRFEFYEAENYIKFLMIPDEYGWRTIWDFRMDIDHWTAEGINMAVSAVMKAVDFMAYMYRR